MRITNNRLGLATMTFMLISGTCVAASDIYRWVDDDGVVHFSEQPPAHGKSEKVDTRAISSEKVEATVDTVTQAEPYNPAEEQEVEEQVSPAQQLREERATARQIAAAEKERLETNCTNADYIISRLEPTPDVLVTDKEGNVSRMNDDVRLQKLSEAQEYAKANCNN